MVSLRQNNKAMTEREFEIFAHEHRLTMVHTARRYLSDWEAVEDATQEALLKLYAMRHSLDGYRSVDALARVVVKHIALNALRSQQRHPTLSLSDSLHDEENGGDNEQISRLLRIIDTLPSKQQMILRMKHIEGLECEEIASIADMSLDAVYQNLSRARRAILQRFKKSDNDET